MVIVGAAFVITHFFYYSVLSHKAPLTVSLNILSSWCICSVFWTSVSPACMATMLRCANFWDGETSHHYSNHSGNASRKTYQRWHIVIISSSHNFYRFCSQALSTFILCHLNLPLRNSFHYVQLMFIMVFHSVMHMIVGGS